MLNILVIALLSLVHFTLCATNMDDMIIGAHLKVYAYDVNTFLIFKKFETIIITTLNWK